MYTSPCSTTSVTYVNDSLPPSFGGPTGAVADSASQLRVFWSPATDNVTPQSQLVYDVCWNTLRRADGGCNPFVAMATTAAGAVVYTLPGLLPQTRYYLQVRARDGVGNTDANNVEVSAQTAGTRVLSRIYARANHACVLTGNGEVRCWGQNTSGQLGDGTTNTSTVPLLVAGLRDVVQLGLGTDHSCALLANGTVAPDFTAQRPDNSEAPAFQRSI